MKKEFLELIEKIKYPDFTDITGYNLNKKVPINLKLFGEPIYWTMKADGENTGVYLDDKGDLQVRTRKTVKISEDLRQRFLALPYTQNIKKLLEVIENANPDKPVMLFGEFMVKGKSPKLIERRNENSFVAFDLWVGFPDPKEVKYPFISWETFHEMCNNFGVPCIKFVEKTPAVNSLEELLSIRERMLTLARENVWEGVVGKIWINGYINMVKEKIVVEHPVSSRDPNAPQLPRIQDSEVEGAIEKVLFEIGVEKFGDEKIAMPMIGKLVKEQCKKHNCIAPGGLAYQMYRERLMRLT